MALRTPPSWLQNGSHPAENDRLSMQALWATTGIIGSSSLAVTANSPVGMSVRVASGWAAIVGTTQANMGVYTVYNDATQVLTVTASDPTNPRIDRVVVTVQDAFYSGAFNDVIFQVIAGTPAGSPVAPATPANSISLATIAVAAAASQINTGDITDTRVAVTTNIPEVGDISAVVAGTGLSGGGSSGSVTLSIDTAVTVDLNTSQTLTNKTLTTPIISSISNTGTLTLPTTTDTLVGRATTDTLTNKTLTAPVINLALNAQTGTTYTPVLADNGKLITLANANPITLTVPLDASVAYAIGAQINIAQTGAGQVTVAGDVGVTVNGTPGLKLRAQYSGATIIKVGTDSWLLLGDLAA